MGRNPDCFWLKSAEREHRSRRKLSDMETPFLSPLPPSSSHIFVSHLHTLLTLSLIKHLIKIEFNKRCICLSQCVKKEKKNNQQPYLCLAGAEFYFASKHIVVIRVGLIHNEWAWHSVQTFTILKHTVGLFTNRSSKVDWKSLPEVMRDPGSPTLKNVTLTGVKKKTQQRR